MEFRQGLEKSNVEIIRASSGEEALKSAKDNRNIALVAVAEELSDMSGLEFARKLLVINAMIGCAAASRLPAAEFHEQSEGLGILMQLPIKPGAKAGEDLLSRLAGIGMT